MFSITSREICVHKYFVQKETCLNAKDESNTDIANIDMNDVIPEILSPFLGLGPERAPRSVVVYDNELDELGVENCVVLGEGASAVVVRAKWQGEDVAMKEYDSNKLDEAVIRDFCQELTLLSYVNIHALSISSISLHGSNCVFVVDVSIIPILSNCWDVLSDQSFEW
jgi:hypothetical protein